MTKQFTTILLTGMLMIFTSGVYAQNCDFSIASSTSALSWYDNTNAMITNWNAAPGTFNYNIEYTTIGAPVTAAYVLHLDTFVYGQQDRL